MVEDNSMVVNRELLYGCNPLFPFSFSMNGNTWYAKQANNQLYNQSIMMKFTQENYDIYIPNNNNESAHGDEESVAAALDRTTYLGIGAHPDDLEFMALHGILHCFDRSNGDCFGGVTCTDGAGSARTSDELSDDALMAIRRHEQRTAAAIGNYSVMIQLNHPSSHAKAASERHSLVADLQQILERVRPRVVYTHNPFDTHASHVGVLWATWEAIRTMSGPRPEQLWGCEVWRGLDWCPDKVVHNVSARPHLAAALNGVYDSQIGGGKRYDLAVEGRRRSNATFLDSHAVDQATHVQYAMDMSELIPNDNDKAVCTLREFCDKHLERFRHDVMGRLDRLEQS